MSRLSVSLAAVALISLIVQSCSDASTAPLTREITLRTCDPGITWAAYQNDGSKIWSRIDLRAGTIVRVTPRLAIASYRPGNDQYGVTIDFLTADQAAAKYSCNEPSVTLKTIHGSVLGLTSPNDAYITITPDAVALLDYRGQFTTTIQDGAVDLVAARQSYSPTAQQFRAPAMIIRHDLNPSDGATLAPLDFTSAEAFAPESTDVTLTGIPSGWSAETRLEFAARGGIGNQLSGDVVSGPTVPVYSVPSTRLENGDYHLLYITAHKTPDYLSISRIYRLPPESVAFGPQLPEPVFTTVASTPALRFRIDMAAQPEYPAAFTISIIQADERRLFVMTASREYFGGTPQTWSLTMPDFSHADGFSSSWELSSDSFHWTAMATSSPSTFAAFGAPRDGRDGDMFRWAIHSGSR